MATRRGLPFFVHQQFARGAEEFASFFQTSYIRVVKQYFNE